MSTDEKAEQKSEKKQQPGIPEGSMTVEQVEQALQQEQSQSHASHYRLAQLYNYVVDYNISKSAGVTSAKEFFKTRVKHVSQATLSRYGAMARRFPESVCTSYGMNALATVVTYAKASGQELKDDPAEVVVSLRDEKGQEQLKPFAECSVDDLREALKQARATERKPVPDNMLASVAKVNKALKQLLPDCDIRLVAHMKGERLCIDTFGTPLDVFDRLYETMRQELLLRRVA